MLITVAVGDSFIVDIEEVYDISEVLKSITDLILKVLKRKITPWLKKILDKLTELCAKMKTKSTYDLKGGICGGYFSASTHTSTDVLIDKDGKIITKEVEKGAFIKQALKEDGIGNTIKANLSAECAVEAYAQGKLVEGFSSSGNLWIYFGLVGCITQDTLCDVDSNSHFSEARFEIAEGWLKALKKLKKFEDTRLKLRKKYNEMVKKIDSLIGKNPTIEKFLAALEEANKYYAQLEEIVKK
jgi:hypothetical protein